MFESSFPIPALSLPAMATLYWICLIVGGGLLIISSLAGGDADAALDAELDVDVSVDSEVDTGHATAGSLASWFSMHFAVFFVAVFGLIGVTLTHLTDQTSGVAFVSALVGGLVIGQGVHQILRKLRRSSGDSTPQPRDYVNKIARVTIAVDHARKGEIAVRVGRAERFIPAIAKRADTMFKSGERVAVVAYRDGVAEIVSREEYEFLTHKRKASGHQSEGEQS